MARELGGHCASPDDGADQLWDDDPEREAALLNFREALAGLEFEVARCHPSPRSAREILRGVALVVDIVLGTTRVHDPNNAVIAQFRLTGLEEMSASKPKYRRIPAEDD